MDIKENIIEEELEEEEKRILEVNPHLTSLENARHKQKREKVKYQDPSLPVQETDNSFKEKNKQDWQIDEETDWTARWKVGFEDALIHNRTARYMWDEAGDSMSGDIRESLEKGYREKYGIKEDDYILGGLLDLALRVGTSAGALSGQSNEEIVHYNLEAINQMRDNRQAPLTMESQNTLGNQAPGMEQYFKDMTEATFSGKAPLYVPEENREEYLEVAAFIAKDPEARKTLRQISPESIEIEKKNLTERFRRVQELDDLIRKSNDDSIAWHEIKNLVVHSGAAVVADPFYEIILAYAGGKVGQKVLNKVPGIGIGKGKQTRWGEIGRFTGGVAATSWLPILLKAEAEAEHFRELGFDENDPLLQSANSRFLFEYAATVGLGGLFAMIGQGAGKLLGKQIGEGTRQIDEEILNDVFFPPENNKPETIKPDDGDGGDGGEGGEGGEGGGEGGGTPENTKPDDGEGGGEGVDTPETETDIPLQYTAKEHPLNIESEDANGRIKALEKARNDYETAKKRTPNADHTEIQSYINDLNHKIGIEKDNLKLQTKIQNAVSNKKGSALSKMKDLLYKFKHKWDHHDSEIQRSLTKNKKKFDLAINEVKAKIKGVIAVEKKFGKSHETQTKLFNLGRQKQKLEGDREELDRDYLHKRLDDEREVNRQLNKEIDHIEADAPGIYDREEFSDIRTFQLEGGPSGDFERAQAPLQTALAREHSNKQAAIDLERWEAEAKRELPDRPGDSLEQKNINKLTRLKRVAKKQTDGYLKRVQRIIDEMNRLVEDDDVKFLSDETRMKKMRERIGILLEERRRLNDVDNIHTVESTTAELVDAQAILNKELATLKGVDSKPKMSGNVAKPRQEPLIKPEKPKAEPKAETKAETKSEPLLTPAKPKPQTKQEAEVVDTIRKEDAREAEKQLEIEAANKWRDENLTRKADEESDFDFSIWDSPDVERFTTYGNAELGPKKDEITGEDWGPQVTVERVETIDKDGEPLTFIKTTFDHTNDAQRKSVGQYRGPSTPQVKIETLRIKGSVAVSFNPDGNVYIRQANNTADGGLEVVDFFIDKDYWKLDVGYKKIPASDDAEIKKQKMYMRQGTEKPEPKPEPETPAEVDTPVVSDKPNTKEEMLKYGKEQAAKPEGSRYTAQFSDEDFVHHTAEEVRDIIDTQRKEFGNFLYKGRYDREHFIFIKPKAQKKTVDAIVKRIVEEAKEVPPEGMKPDTITKAKERFANDERIRKETARVRKLEKPKLKPKTKIQKPPAKYTYDIEKDFAYHTKDEIYEIMDFELKNAGVFEHTHKGYTGDRKMQRYVNPKHNKNEYSSMIRVDVDSIVRNRQGDIVKKQKAAAKAANERLAAQPKPKPEARKPKKVEQTKSTSYIIKDGKGKDFNVLMAGRTTGIMSGVYNVQRELNVDGNNIRKTIPFNKDGNKKTVEKIEEAGNCAIGKGS